MNESADRPPLRDEDPRRAPPADTPPPEGNTARVSSPGEPVSGSGQPASTPGERRLVRPPSDRYREAEARAASRAQPDESSLARGISVASVVAIVGAIAIVLLGGVLAVTAGLVVLAGAIGGGVALALRWGAGRRLLPPRRVLAAVALTVAAVGIGQLGIWQYARVEGGVLPLLDYLGEVYGILVPLELLVGAGMAWLAAR